MDRTLWQQLIKPVRCQKSMEFGGWGWWRYVHGPRRYVVYTHRKAICTQLHI